jgi:autotransporter-associated beta strand protein
VTDGNLVLNGNNAFTNLGINAGTVTLGSNTAGGIADIAINNGATLASGAVGLVITNQIVTTATGLIASNGNTFTLNGRIIGPGSISHVSGGNLVLNGNNAFTNLGINAGTVTLGSNTAGGVADIAINSGATLAAGVSGLVVANQIVTTGAATVNSGTGTFTLSGRIIGPGGLTKTGSGLLTLTGSGSGYTGATTVAAGELRVNSAIATSAFTVQSGARLSGTGTLGGLTVQSGGTVAPGTSPGTLNVAGPVTFLAGSTYAAEVTPTAADRITATGALSLNGTLAVAASGSFTSFNQTFTVASGSSRTGTFSSVTGLAGFGAPFNPLVEYTGTLVNVRLAPASLVGLAGSGLGPNALEVARAFDRAVAGGFNPQGFFGLYTQGANLGNVLGQLSGETYAAQRRVAMEDTRVIRETAFDRLNSGVGSADGNTRTASTSGAEAETTVWLRGVGSWGTAKADGVGSRFTTEQLGVLTGLDYAKGGFKVGAAFTYTQNDIESVAGDARVKSTGGALYAGYADPSGFKIGAGGSVAGTRSTNNRSVIIAPAVQSLRGSVDGTTYQLFGELAYDIAAGPTTQVTPFARYAYVNHRANAFTETGGNAAVSGVRESTDISVITAGLRAAFSIGENAKITGSAGYQNITGDRAGNATLALTGLNQPMNIRAVALDKDSAALEARADFRIGANATIGVGYSGVIGSNNQDHGARATLTFGF